MKRHDLIRHNGTILRVLFVDSIKTQVVDCGCLRMPRWVATAELKGSEPVSEEQMRTECEIALTPETDLTPEQRRQAHQRYTVIAGILAVLDNDLLRNQMITQAAEENGISRRTVTTYLCTYLRTMDISVLADPVRDPGKTLTRDQKNMRWALNKYFYSHEKNSLPTAYTMMLKERYCDPEGKLDKYYVKPMASILFGIEEHEAEPTNNGLYVAGSDELTDACSVLYQHHVLRNFCFEHDLTECFILPSSIHECIICTPEVIGPYQEMAEMVRAINSEIVEPEEQMPACCFKYDFVEDLLLVVAEASIEEEL